MKPKEVATVIQLEKGLKESRLILKDSLGYSH
jgi:hypothetical protein